MTEVNEENRDLIENRVPMGLLDEANRKSNDVLAAWLADRQARAAERGKS